MHMVATAFLTPESHVTQMSIHAGRAETATVHIGEMAVIPQSFAFDLDNEAIAAKWDEIASACRKAAELHRSLAFDKDGKALTITAALRQVVEVEELQERVAERKSQGFIVSKKTEAALRQITEQGNAWITEASA